MQQQPIWLLLCLYVLTWTASQLVSNPNLDPYGDMLENFVWGQEFVWGHAKHPPLVGWITGAWFAVLPQNLASYLLLSYLNAAVGLCGVYVLGRLLGLRELARCTPLILALALPYTTLAAKFNANAILLAVWPWIFVGWLGCFQSRGVKAWAYALLLGCAASLGLLGKYYTGVLLLSLGILTLLLPEGRRGLLRPQPWLALIVCVALLAPHIIWLQDHEYVTFRYVEAQGSGAVDYSQLLKFALAPLGYFLIPWLGLWVMVPDQRWRVFWRMWRPQGRTDVVFWLFLLPYLLSLAFGVSGLVHLSSPWALPLGFALPLFWMRNLAKLLDAEQTAQLSRSVQNLFIGYLCFALLVAPAYAWYQSTAGQNNYYLPTEEAMIEVEVLWFERFDTDYRWVSGDHPQSAALAFYGVSGADFLRTLPTRPEGDGIVLCHLGPAQKQVKQSMCTLRAERWLRSRRSKVTLQEFTIAREGVRFSLEIPHVYRAYFYRHRAE